MLALSKRESEIYDALSRQPGREMSVEDIADIIYERKPRPQYWRHGLLVTLRYLALKTESQPLKITRSSSLGRGNKAKFSIMKGSRK